MKLATLRSGAIDGELVVVSSDLAQMVRARDIAPTLQAALDDWGYIHPLLEERYKSLVAGRVPKAEPFDPTQAHSPLPRAYQWCDGSTYAAHTERMSRWRNMEPSELYALEPFMYQGASDGFLAPTDDIPAASEEWGIDYEAEVAIITDSVPYGTSVEEAGRHIALVMLCNDVSLRNLIPHELSKGFGFVQSKPASAFSPVAVTPDELGDAWRDWRVHLPLRSWVNGTLFGEPDAGEMLHGFDRLIGHMARTRSLTAGTIVGGGTVANRDSSRGTSCIIERRVLEQLTHGQPQTQLLHYGDRVRIEMFDAAGKSIFGAIDQKVAQFEAKAPGMTGSL
jgi:fumarylacetoacetate (FAA) hydrolase